MPAARLSVLLLLVGCGGGGNPQGSGDGGPDERCVIDPSKCEMDADIDAYVYDETPPVLSVTPVDLTGTYDPASMRLGDLACDWWDVANGMCFRAFGLEVDVPNHPLIPNPTIDLHVPTDTPVRAVTDGVVGPLTQKTDPVYGPNCWTFMTQTSPSSAYSVEYDHIKDPVVTEGAVLHPGDVIGTACVDLDGALMEIGVHYHMSSRDGTSANVCPTDFGTSEFNDRMAAALAAQAAAYPDSPWTASAVCVVDRTQ